jgi:hypothetical protein
MRVSSYLLEIAQAQGAFVVGRVSQLKMDNRGCDKLIKSSSSAILHDPLLFEQQASWLENFSF